MIRLSLNVIWSSCLLLRRIAEYRVHSLEEVYISSVGSVNLDILFELAEKCHWFTKDHEGIAVLSPRGEELLRKEGPKQSQEMIADYIVYVNPSWAKRIPYGRKESFIFMNKDEQACFYEAGLMEDPPSITTIQWWDRLSNYARNVINERKTSVGRRGELATIQFEYKRIGLKPHWMSIDSNLAGYDIISRCARDNPEELLIEVKSSEESIQNAYFYISSHEWQTARTANNYRIYVWSFGETSKLAVIKPEQLSQQIPTNNETGEWQTVRIPFASYIEKFCEVDLGGNNDG